MKILFLAAAALTSFFSDTPTLTVKSESVKIEFLADMDNTAGSLSGFEATINFDMEDLANSSITGTVDVNTLSTENEKRDNHLKSKDFFEAETYPTMSFSSTSFTEVKGAIQMDGKMKIKDVERDESITFTYADNVFKGEGTIQAYYYNMGYSDKKPGKTNVKISFVIPVL